MIFAQTAIGPHPLPNVMPFVWTAWQIGRFGLLILGLWLALGWAATAWRHGRRREVMATILLVVYGCLGVARLAYR